MCLRKHLCFYLKSQTQSVLEQQSAHSLPGWAEEEHRIKICAWEFPLWYQGGKKKSHCSSERGRSVSKRRKAAWINITAPLTPGKWVMKWKSAERPGDIGAGGEDDAVFYNVNVWRQDETKGYTLSHNNLRTATMSSTNSPSKQNQNDSWSSAGQWVNQAHREEETLWLLLLITGAKDVSFRRCYTLCSYTNT